MTYCSVNFPETEEIEGSNLEPDTLYLQAETAVNGVYIKLDKTLYCFENGAFYKSTNGSHVKYIRAPKGTSIKIEAI